MKKIAALCALTLTLLTAISHADDKMELICRVGKPGIPQVQKQCDLDVKKIEFFQYNSITQIGSSVSYKYDLSLSGKILKLEARAMLFDNSPKGQIALSYTTPDGITIDESNQVSEDGYRNFVSVIIRNQDPGFHYFYCTIRKVEPGLVDDYSDICK